MKMPPAGMCCVVTVLPCDVFKKPEDFWKESPEGCCSCGMLEWLGAFETEKETNEAFVRQYSDQFENGVHVGVLDREFRENILNEMSVSELKDRIMEMRVEMRRLKSELNK